MTQPNDTPLAYLGFQLIPPSPALRPYVRSYWYFQRDTPLTVHHEEYMHPQGGFGIVFNFGDQLSLDGRPISEPVFLDGTNTVSRKMGFSGHVEQLGISFWVGGAYPVLNVPLAELLNQFALLDALDEPTLMPLYSRLHEVGSLPERIRLLEQWLCNRLSIGNERDPLVPASLAALREGAGHLLIPALAEKFAISQRQLERLYHSQVGMSPKQYSQLLRVETARLALKQLHGQSTTSLAMELGFYDQSHFIREFSAVIGMSPYSYLKRSRKPSQSGED